VETYNPTSAAVIYYPRILRYDRANPSLPVVWVASHMRLSVGKRALGCEMQAWLCMTRVHGSDMRISVAQVPKPLHEPTDQGEGVMHLSDERCYCDG
jgi:hypothetical protein